MRGLKKEEQQSGSGSVWDTGSKKLWINGNQRQTLRRSNVKNNIFFNYSWLLIINENLLVRRKEKPPENEFRGCTQRAVVRLFGAKEEPGKAVHIPAVNLICYSTGNRRSYQIGCSRVKGDKAPVRGHGRAPRRTVPFGP